MGNALDWTAMRSFMHHLPIDSAMGQELHPEYAPWATRTKTNAILADIFDVLAQINANLVAMGSKRSAKQPKPYPRPRQKESKIEWNFGQGEPPPELREWFKKKRKEKCQ